MPLLCRLRRRREKQNSRPAGWKQPAGFLSSNDENSLPQKNTKERKEDKDTHRSKGGVAQSPGSTSSSRVVFGPSAEYILFAPCSRVVARSLTEYQGHAIGIDCVAPHVVRGACDNVALSIGVKFLTTQPLLCTADVCWGSGGPNTGLDVLPVQVPWSDDAIRNIERQLPRLVESLAEELSRLDGSD